MITITLNCKDSTVCKIDNIAQWKKINALFSSKTISLILTLHVYMVTWILILEFSTVISLLPTRPNQSRSETPFGQEAQLRTTDLEDQVHPLVASHGSLLTRFNFLFQTVVCQSCFNGILSQHYKGQRTRSVTEQHHLKYRNSRSKFFIHNLLY